MDTTDIYVCHSCHKEWEAYAGREKYELRKCSICLAGMCKPCHKNKDNKQHCFACRYPKGKTKEEVKADIEYRRFLNSAVDDLTDNRPTPTGSLLVVKDSNAKDKPKDKPKEDTQEITIIPLAFNVMRINSGMTSNDMTLPF
jgi:hypothetical protein